MTVSSSLGSDFNHINELREKIRVLEKSLLPYGFDERRGIETLKISELKKLLYKSGDPGKVKELLKELVEAQKTLYHELYHLAGARQMIVDTDTPEKRLEEIKMWLEGGRRTDNRPQSLFVKAVLTALDVIEGKRNHVSLLETLGRIYKRDYDRFRVLRFLSSICKEFGLNIETDQQDLNHIAEAVAFNISRIGVSEVRELVKVKLKS